jgi:hypothetical protein
VIYIKGSCSQSITSIIGLISVLINGVSSVIKCVKKRLANIVVILKA